MCSTENPVLKNVQINFVHPNQKKSEEHDKLLSHTLSKLPTLPKFKLPRKILMDEMESLITKHCHQHKPLFLKTFYIQIQSRLADLFQGRSIQEVYSIPPPDVIKMYREVYNKSTDESFVIETYELVKLACWPTKETMKDGNYCEEIELEDEGKINTNTLVNSELQR